MEAVTLRELKASTDGLLLGNFYDPDTQITDVSSDNRKVHEGSVFFAFKGEKTDGHRYVKAALEAGAAGAVVSEDPVEYIPGKFYLLVEDTLRAAAQFAAYYRSRFDIPVVSVTGSVGKTTTKDMIAAVFQEKFRTVRTQKNFNNYIGVPRTVFTMDDKSEIAVIEMGMNHRGEIHHLVSIAKPSAVTITNVGDAHIGFLGSRENIFRAKAEIFGGLAEGGYAVLNGDDAYLKTLRNKEVQDLIRATTGMPEHFDMDWIGEDSACTYRAVNIQDNLPDCVKFTALTPEGEVELSVPAVGHHMIYPALTALALGRHFGESLEEIRQGIAHYVPTGMRMETLELPGRILVYNDTYNANPQSMEEALRTLANVQGKKRIAVLGNMGELGSREEELHRQVGAFAAKLGIDELITVGDAAEYIADEAGKEGLRHIISCRDKEAAKVFLKDLISPDTAFLVKASRAAALEELVSFIRESTKEESVEEQR